MVNPPKELTVEQIYLLKKSQLEHILLRPDTYIGSRTCGYGTLSTRK
jgi:DNA gyrase/topoisomerase IV subunit B